MDLIFGSTKEEIELKKKEAEVKEQELWASIRKQADADNQESATEDFFDLVFEKEAHHGNRNHGNEDIQYIFFLIILSLC